MNAADLLLSARRTGVLVNHLPDELQPTDLEEAYFVQDTMAAAYGPIGGWKIGAPTPEATPMFAPMPLAWTGTSNAVLSSQNYRYRGLEAEIAFLMAIDLPPRAEPYSMEEILAAIDSCHPAIEVLETAFIDPNAAARPSTIADMQMHGGFIYGPACPGWKNIDFSGEQVNLVIDGVLRVERVGSNTAGNFMRLLPYLANEGAARTGGLKAGQWITTGSWTGNIQTAPDSVVDVVFKHAGEVSLRFV